METPEDQFYIGWQEAAPPVFAQMARRAVWLLAALAAGLAALLTLNQRGFDASVFEFGTYTTLEGILMMEPVPMLKVKAPDGQRRSILLVGAGKHGAEASLLAAAQAQGRPLDGVSLRLRGYRIYYQGQEALELTDGAGAFAGFGAPDTHTVRRQALGPANLQGEILDPKCALGVMKPGSGKPHRSCAIRCISGGIPPLIRMADASGRMRYALLLDPEGKPLRDAVLPYVADPIQVSGRLERQDDWLFLYVQPASDISRIAAGHAGRYGGCGSARFTASSSPHFPKNL